VLRKWTPTKERTFAAPSGSAPAAAGTAWAGAALARCRGMLDEDFDTAFTEALELDDRPMPFERARTLLGYGRRLHRARRRAEARDRLREALARFERLGAVPWADQARRELQAAGRAAARRTTRLPRRSGAWLPRSPVAPRTGGRRRAVPGAQDRRAPLHQIDRKLGIRSRAQLVATLAREAAPPKPPAVSKR
jgi:hypothetical protein